MSCKKEKTKPVEVPDDIKREVLKRFEEKKTELEKYIEKRLPQVKLGKKLTKDGPIRYVKFIEVLLLVNFIFCYAKYSIEEGRFISVQVPVATSGIKQVSWGDADPYPVTYADEIEFVDILIPEAADEL